MFSNHGNLNRGVPPMFSYQTPPHPMHPDMWQIHTANGSTVDHYNTNIQPWHKNPYVNRPVVVCLK